MNAQIKENKAYCPFCMEHNYRMVGYNQIKEGTQMTCICKGCSREFEYVLTGKEERIMLED